MRTSRADFSLRFNMRACMFIRYFRVARLILLHIVKKGIFFSELLIQSMLQWLACLELPQLSQGFFLVLVFHI